MKLIVLNENCELTKRISELCKHKPFKLLLLPALLYILSFYILLLQINLFKINGNNSSLEDLCYLDTCPKHREDRLAEFYANHNKLKLALNKTLFPHHRKEEDFHQKYRLYLNTKINKELKEMKGLTKNSHNHVVFNNFN
jgi:hypothetical protein